MPVVLATAPENGMRAEQPPLTESQVASQREGQGLHPSIGYR